MRIPYKIVICISALMTLSQGSFAAWTFLDDVSGTWEQEVSYSTNQHQLQKFESLIEPEWTDSFGAFEMTAIARIRLDSESELGSSFSSRRVFDHESRLNDQREGSKHGEIGLREFYLDTELMGAFWRIGKQQIVWGQSDGLKVLDQVNPQSFREFILDDFDDSRIPLWMLNVEIPFEDDTLQLLWIPDTSTHELPENGAAYEFRSKALIPTPPLDNNGNPLIPVSIKSVSTPKKFWEDSDVGLRYSMFTESGWDISFNYLYHYLDLPVLYQQLVGDGLNTRIEVRPTFERSHLIGGTLSNAFGDFTLRTELGYNTDTYHLSQNIQKKGIENNPELSMVIGLDYQGISDMFISFQWFQSHLFDYDSSIIRDQDDQTLTLLVQRNFINETVTLEALFIQSMNGGDGLARPKITYQLSSEIEIFGGVDLFYGNQDGLFGQFDKHDRVNLGFKYGF